MSPHVTHEIAVESTTGPASRGLVRIKTLKAPSKEGAENLEG